MKKSLRRQLILLMISVVAGALLLIGLLNYAFLGRFYRQQKIQTIAGAYNVINRSIDTEDPDSFLENLTSISSQNNLEILITDAAFTPFCAIPAENKEMESRLFGYYTGLYRDEKQELYTSDRFRIQNSVTRSDLSYLELWGDLDDGNIVLIRTPMEAIRESVSLSNRFYAFGGILAILCTAILTWFLARRFTAPLRELTEISSSMTALNFNARYKVREKGGNEIDELGEHFNKMSDQLAGTITDLKNANLALQKDVEEKEAIDRMRVDFLNNVSHELKTPITLIGGYAEGLRDGIAEDPESRAEYLDVIIDESAKMDLLVRQLLSLSKLESGNEKPELAVFDLTQLIRESLRTMAVYEKQNGIRFLFKEEGPVPVWGDAYRIEEVLRNYLTNAVHYALHEKVVEIRVIKEEDLVTVSVFNTGDPIPEVDLPHIFEKFYRVDKSRSREYGGTGLGLSIVKAVMDAHGQTCGARNYDNGVAFYFTLEAADDRDH